jgi:hypothetical protein
VKSLDIIVKELIELIISEGTMQKIKIRVLFKIIKTNSIEDVIDIVCFDIPLQYSDEGFTTLSVYYHQADHGVYDLV